MNNAPLLEDNKNFLKITQRYIRKSWEWFKKNQENVNALATVVSALATIALLVVSIFLINATYSLVNVTKKLGQLEASLALDKQKLEIIDQIRIAENLLIETQQNKVEINNIKDSLSDFINGSEIKETYIMTYKQDTIDTTRTVQAKESLSLSSYPIRIKLDNYLDTLNILKEHLKGISTATEGQDLKNKRERIGSFITLSNVLLESIDDFIKDIEDYIKEREDAYKETERLANEKLLKIFE